MQVNSKKFPILFCGILPDKIDLNGVPLLEGGTLKHKEYLEKIDYRECKYQGLRSSANLPMNTSALKALDSKIWQHVMLNYKWIPEPGGLNIGQRIFRLSKACLYLPHAISQSNSAVFEKEIADTFKTLRGVALYAEHRLAWEESEERSLSMYQYTESKGLFVGRQESCPAPKAVTDLLEQDIITFLSGNEKSIIEPNHCSLSIDVVERALNVAMLGTLFYLSATIFSMKYVRAFPDWDKEKLPMIPYLKSGLQACQENRSKEYTAGLLNLLQSTEIRVNDWADIKNMLLSLENLDGNQSHELIPRFNEIFGKINASLIENLSAQEPRPSNVEIESLTAILFRTAGNSNA